MEELMSIHRQTLSSIHSGIPASPMTAETGTGWEEEDPKNQRPRGGQGQSPGKREER